MSYNTTFSVLLVLSFSLVGVATADDTTLMQLLIDTVRANKGAIRTWKGTAFSEYEREDTRNHKAYAERCTRSIEFATDVTLHRSRSVIVIDTLEQSVDGVTVSPLPDNSAGMIKDGTCYDYTWKSPDREGIVILDGKPVNMRGSETTPLFRTLPNVPTGFEKSNIFFDPLSQMDYEFRDYTSDFASLIVELEEKETTSLPQDFSLTEKNGILIFSRTISQQPQANQQAEYITRETFDLNKGGLIVESYHVVKKDDNIVSERSARTVPHEVCGVWIPQNRTETFFEPDSKLIYKLTWTKNEINVPVDDEFTFAKMGVARGALALDLKTGKESLLTGDQYVAPAKVETPGKNIKIVVLSVCPVILIMILVLRRAFTRRRCAP